MNAISLNTAREKILGLIADTLLETPVLTKIEILCETMKNFSASCGGECNSKLAKGTQLLEEWLLDNKGNKNIATILNQEHTALFFIGTYSIGSTASYYLTETHSNKGKPRDECIAFYTKYGRTPKRTALFDEDSLGVQILFLCSLISEGDETLAVQKEFWDKHIKPWFEIFCLDIYKKSAENSFFHAFTLITEGYLEADREIMDMLSE